MPETFIIDSAGVIRYKHVGPLNARVIEETLMPMLDRMKQEKTSKTLDGSRFAHWRRP